MTARLELYQKITGRSDGVAGAVRKALREGYLIKDRRACGIAPANTAQSQGPRRVSLTRRAL